MTTLGLTVLGFFEATVGFVALAFCVGDGASTESLFALLLFTPLVVGSTGSSAAFRLDFVVGSGSAGGDEKGFTAFLVAVFVSAAFVFAFILEVIALEAVFEAAFTPFTWEPASCTAMEAFFGDIAILVSEEVDFKSKERM